MFGLVQDEQTNEDYLEVIEDINFIVHKDILEQFGSFIVDYKENYFRKGFVVSSAYGSGSC